MAKSETDVWATNTDWLDLTVVYPETANVPVNIQCKGPGNLVVFFSPSSTKPTDDSGWVRQPLDDATGTAAHIYVKALDFAQVRLAVGLTD